MAGRCASKRCRGLRPGSLQECFKFRALLSAAGLFDAPLGLQAALLIAGIIRALCCTRVVPSPCATPAACNALYCKHSFVKFESLFFYLALSAHEQA